VPLRFWQRWRAERVQQRRAARYIRTLQREPAVEDVEWLTAAATGGDADHARWELRYARRAIGLLTAERDALDDRTASLVARELTRSLARDPQVAAGMLPVAERQLNARLRGYGDALARREGGRLVRAALGRALLTFAGGESYAPTDAAVQRAGETLARYISEANQALRAEFGAAALPEDLPPSAAMRG
jgi:hypothetical protein